MDIPVEEFKVGDRLALLNGRGVQVEKITCYDDEQIIVRWHTGPVIRSGRTAGERDTLGSFQPRRRGETISVQRRVEAIA